MEFLNLQHSGERDSELAQKKENFDNYVVKITVKNNHFKDQERSKKKQKVALPLIPAREIKQSPMTQKSGTEIRESYFQRTQWTETGSKQEEERKGGRANDNDSEQDKKSALSGTQMQKSRMEKEKADEPSKVMNAMYPLRDV